MTAMLADYFLKKKPGSTILYNATCGWAVPETIEQNHGKGIRTKVGHSFIKAEMRSKNALFAGESSGHYYFKDNFMADSGLIAALVALQIISLSGKPLSEITKGFIRYYQIPETNFKVENKQAILDKLAEEFKDIKQDQLDGLTIWLENAWVNIRPSNTESILRLNAEAKSQSELDSVVEKVTKIISG
jgi:phosphomannomutase